MQLTFPNLTVEQAHDLIDAYEDIVNAEPTGTVPEAPARQPGTAPVESAPSKPKRERKPRSDKGLRREPYGPRIAPNTPPQEQPAPTPAPVQTAAPAPEAKPEGASAPAEKADVRPAPAEVASTAAPQAAPSGEASPAKSKDPAEAARDALTRVFNKMGRETSMAILQRHGVAKLSQVPADKLGLFIGYCDDVLAGKIDPTAATE